MIPVVRGNRKRSRNISEMILEGVFVMKELWDLFVTFARIGGFTFGGGYAMLPMLQKEVVEARHWATEEELVDYFAIGQCTPGIIAVNTATFIGYKLRGVIGGIVATLGVIAPSMVIITIIAAFIKGFADIAAVGHAFAGVRACVCVLIFNAVVKLGKKSLINKTAIGVFVVILALALFTNLSPALLVILAGLFGALNGMRTMKGGKEA